MEHCYIPYQGLLQKIYVVRQIQHQLILDFSFLLQKA